MHLSQALCTSQREAPDSGAGASAWDPLILFGCGRHFADIPVFLQSHRNVGSYGDSIGISPGRGVRQQRKPRQISVHAPQLASMACHVPQHSPLSGRRPHAVPLPDDDPPTRDHLAKFTRVTM